MSKAQGIRAGRAFIEIGGDSLPFVRAMQAASKGLQELGQKVAAVGARVQLAGTAMTKAFFGASKAFASIGDSLDEMSSRTGLTVELLSELKLAAEQSGAGLESLEKGFRNVQRVLVAAAGGSGEAAKKLAMVGLSVEDLVGKSPDEQLNMIADAISQIGDPALKAVAAMALMGKSGAQLLPLLEGGAAGLEKFRAKSRGLGIGISTDDAKKAAKLQDALEDLWATVKGVVVAIGAALAPTVQYVSEVMTGAATGAINFIKSNRELVTMAGMAAVAIVGVGTAIVALGGIAMFAGAAIGAVTATVSTMVGVFVAVKAVVLALFTPLGAIGAVLGGLLVYTLVATGAIDGLGEAFSKLTDVASTTLGGIVDALSSGDLALAADIAWKGLYAAWLAGTMPLRQAWHAFWGGLNSTAIDIFFGVQQAIAAFWEWFRTSTLAVGRLVETAWISITSFFTDAWERAIGGVTNMLYDLAKVSGAANLLGIDVDALKKDNAEETRLARERVETDRKNRQDTLDKKIGERMAAVEEQTAKWQKSLADARKAAQELNDDDTAAALKGVQDEYEKAAANLKSLREKAAAKVAGKENAPAAPPKIPSPDGMGDRGFQQAMLGFRGSFFAFDRGAFQGPGTAALKNIEKNTKDTADLLQVLVNRQPDDGLIAE